MQSSILPIFHRGLLSREARGTPIWTRFIRNLAAIALLAAVYFVAGKLGLRLAFVHPSATPVWAPTGIALAALLLFGYWVWPGIFLGAFLVNLTTAGSLATSVGIGIGNTLEPVLGAYLVSRFAGGRQAFHRPQDVLKFALFAGLLSPTVSATFGVTSLSLGGFASWVNYGAIWVTWWLGDAVGALLVAPLLVLWAARPRIAWSRGKVLEAAVLLLGLLFLGELVFGPSAIASYQRASLAFPLVCWAALRFGQRGSVATTFILAAIAIWRTLHGFGPFVMATPNESLLWVQAFVIVFDLTGLVLAAAIAERRHAEERFRLVIESAPSAMVMVGKDGQIVLVNSQAEKWFGYKREELIGRPVEMLVPARFRGDHAAFRKGFYDEPRTRPMGAGRDLYAVRKDGTEFPVEIGLNPIETEEGILVLSAIVDITERKQAEDALRRAKDELEVQVQQRTEELSNTIGALQAEALERKRAESVVSQLSGRLLTLQDEERRRIARELHDSTGQKAAALAIDLAVVSANNAALEPRAREALSECAVLSEQIAQEVRTLSYLLHPPLLDEVGLESAIRWYADGITQRSGLLIDLKVPREFRRLPAEIETALFRVLQECLRNIVLHSGSKEARIRITQDSHEVKLEVSDRGRGIPPGTLDPSGQDGKNLGVGILGMRERMKQLGGSLQINSSSRGTVISAIVPVGSSPDARSEAGGVK